MASQVIRWLHLSDFHVGKDGYAQRKMFEYIIGNVQKKKAEGFIPDFVFITGDLANKGLSSEYMDFWLEFVEPLQAEIGDGIEERIFVVPGNHDVDRTHNQAFSREEMSDERSCYFDSNEAWAEPSNGGGYEFLAVQCGAAFQAREREKWRNGLIWGQLNQDTRTVHLQPWRWTSDQQAWTLAADAFPEPLRQDVWWIYPLPGTGIAKQLTVAAKPNSVQPPKGWSVSTVEDLHKHLAPLEEEAAIKFFDGAVPTWQTALSASIPRRKIVGRLVEHFHDADSVNRPIVSLLLAAGCEGKTTAMLQTAYEVVRNNAEWRILRRVDDAEPLIPALILPVLTKPYRWLMLLDEADRTAEALFNFLRQLPRDLQGRLHFLVACRDSDWQASEAYNLNWLSACTFQQDTLSGLGKDDAQKIVSAWGNFGKMGLGDLRDVPEAERASVLDQKAHEESKTTHGAFFGALLAVRHGTDLPNHARLMLERLNQRSIPGGTLRDALAYIAIMHAEGLEFLSRSVLAQALACPPAKLHREVIAPLGQEAAATATASFIFTRHRRIAETLAVILEKDLADDVSERFVELGMAAIDAAERGEHVPNLAFWRYHFAEHFFDSGRKTMALEIARGVLSREPQNIMTLVGLAKLYRRTGLFDDALKLFRTLPKSVKIDRTFMTEWAYSEADFNDYATSALLTAFALSDDCHWSRVDTKDGIICFSAINKAFQGLFTGYREKIFRDARAAASVLALQLNLSPADRITFRRILDDTKEDGSHTPSLEKAFDLFRQGVIAAENAGVDESAEFWIPDAASLDFSGLQRLVYSSIEARKR